MRPNLSIPQLCCMPRSNPKTNIPFKDSIMIVPICSKTIPPRQSLWIENTLQNTISGVKKSVKGRIEMYLRSFQTIQIWNDFSLDASTTLAYSRRHLCFIRDSLSSLKMKIHRIAPNIKINKIYHAIFRVNSERFLNSRKGILDKSRWHYPMLLLLLFLLSPGESVTEIH